MTNEELAETIDKLNQRLSLTIEAVQSIRKIMELQSQRLDNIETELFQKPKEP